jgi:hypothetical protein
MREDMDMIEQSTAFEGLWNGLGTRSQFRETSLAATGGEIGKEEAGAQGNVEGTCSRVRSELSGAGFTQTHVLFIGRRRSGG